MGGYAGATLAAVRAAPLPLPLPLPRPRPLAGMIGGTGGCPSCPVVRVLTMYERIRTIEIWLPESKDSPDKNSRL